MLLQPLVLNTAVELVKRALLEIKFFSRLSFNYKNTLLEPFFFEGEGM